jgi:hypothetical protein
MSDITIKIECHACRGTGLYVGMAERNGAAVICHRCDGTGGHDYKYTPFTKRKKKEGVKRVYKTSAGHAISAEDVVNENGRRLPFSTSGVSYEEWLNGKQPKDLEFLGCPMLADQQACHEVEGFYERCCKISKGYANSITACPSYNNPDECWKLFKKGNH